MKKNMHYARYVLWALPLWGVGLHSAQAELKHFAGSDNHVKAGYNRTEAVLLESGIYMSGLRQSDVPVSGKVTGENGEGLPGVTVQLKGTTRGTATDLEGNFTLPVPDGKGTLVVSFIGYTTQEVAVNNQTSVNVSLSPDTKALQEVVVVGYGTQSRNDLTVSVASVEGEAVAERGTVSPLQAVQGQVAGADISASSGRAGASYNIQIRGANTLSGNTSPLYVVDGVITDNIDFLNPQDIAKLDVLKDAASTAVYGSRGSNGVVIVTTKRGTGVKGGTTISYDGYVGIRQNARMPDFMNGDEFWEYRQNAYITPELLKSPVGDYETVIQNQLNRSPTLARRVANREYFDWPSYLLQTGIQTNHWLNVSGNSGKGMQYVIGAGYQKEKGNLSNETFEKYNLKASIDHKINEKWSAGLNFNLSLSERELGSDLAITNAYRMSPLVSPYDEEGELVFRPGQYDNLGFTSSVNPIIDNENSENNTRTTFGLGNIYLQVAPVSWLNVRTTLSPNFRNSRQGRYSGSLTETRGGQLASASLENASRFGYIWDNVLTANKSFGEHAFSFTGLYSMQYDRIEASEIIANNLPFNSSFHNLGTASDRTVGSGFEKSTILSYMVRLNYSFKDKYLVTLTTRWDGSSRLAAGNKWSSFPSASFAWRLSEEDFLRSSGLVSDLKLRLSAGISGNNNGVDPYGTLANISSPLQYDFDGSLALGYRSNNLVNPDLTWEKAREYNIGVDFGFFNGRISGSIDAYDKRSNGLILEVEQPIESGWESVFANVGAVRNRGVEAVLRTVNISNNDFSWSTNFTFAHNKNTILELLNGEEDMVGNGWFIGEPVNANYNYAFDGIWQESERELALEYGQLPGQARVKDLNNDGVINSDDRTIIGSSNPSWTGGFSTNLVYKQFDLSAALFTRQGVQVVSPFHNEFLNLADRGRTKLNVNYYMPENTVTQARESNEYPQPNNVGQYWSEIRAYKNASFVKVQNISLGYTFSPDLLQKLRIKSTRVYANVLNPFVFTKYDGFDPEYARESLVNSGTSNITYQFGVNLKF
ncbi:SusC/RagA family TonB-linked outer membrane protein [Pontibacter silvestris]|uniref:SusC/RagA family TonB-linked outer membrane protein n=1 Tax=Pontibacter silvestris TaxID=2305183 RepID=A0ABW4WYY0_9BACT|nr:TonB-dependent receptor [Pontibacter silvestris]MCC9135591.1 TonB-dependent receptor [Pontibacter silvestris]